MTSPTPRDWEELKKLAEAATPGPWFALDKCEKVNGMRSWWFEVTQNDQYGQSLVHIQARDNMQANAAFIAAFNPATVLELIAEVERLRANFKTVDEALSNVCDERDEAYDLNGKLQKDIDEITSANSDLAGWSKAKDEQLSQLKAERDRMAEEVKSLRSCSSIKPKEFDLVKRTEWARLAHEAWGYIHTCHREHGTDLQGRLHAIKGLKEMSRIIRETLPPRSALNTGDLKMTNVINELKFLRAIAPPHFFWTGGPDQTEDPEWIVEMIRSGDATFENVGTPEVEMHLFCGREGYADYVAKPGDLIVKSGDGAYALHQEGGGDVALRRSALNTGETDV